MLERLLCLIFLFAFGTLGTLVEALAQPLSYFVRDSIPIPGEPPPTVIAVRDMDADGILDVVVANRTTLTILEYDGNLVAVRFTHSEPPSYTVSLRSPLVAEVDGDMTPEIIFGTFTHVRVWEASGNNSYVPRLGHLIGSFVDSIKVGDSDGDGRREILASREHFPSSLTKIEAVSNNSYSVSGVLLGDGGNVTVAGTADLDQDGIPETVFSDDGYDTTVGRIYVYEGETLVFTDPSLELLSHALADTDGNGLGEIIGRRSSQTRLKVLESTGSGDGFQIVFDQLNDYHSSPLDADGDGRSEFWRSVLDETGERRTFTLAYRSGSQLVDFYDSGSLLHGYPGNIDGILAIADTNANGHPELAVMQGGLLHILEPLESQFPNPSVPPSIPIPALSLSGLTLLILLLLTISLKLLANHAP